MVVVLGFHAFGILSSSCRLISDLEKLHPRVSSLFRKAFIIPNMSSTFSLSFIVKYLYQHVRVTTLRSCSSWFPLQLIIKESQISFEVFNLQTFLYSFLDKAQKKVYLTLLFNCIWLNSSSSLSFFRDDISISLGVIIYDNCQCVDLSTSPSYLSNKESLLQEKLEAQRGSSFYDQLWLHACHIVGSFLLADVRHSIL